MNASDQGNNDNAQAIKVFSPPKPKENEKDSTCSFDSRESGKLDRIKTKRRLTLNTKKSIEDRRKMSIEIDPRQLEEESKTPFPKGVNFEEKKSAHDLSEVIPQQPQIREIILDLKEQQWKQDCKKIIEEVIEHEESPHKREKNIESQTTVSESPIAETCMLKKELREKELQAYSLTKENEILQNMVIKLSQEIQSFNALMESQKNFEEKIDELKRELLNNREKIKNMKYNQAYMIQEFYETSNEEALEHAIKYLSV